MATALFSQRSSNPLEHCSSDSMMPSVRRRASMRFEQPAVAQSSDPISGYDGGEMDPYWQQVKELQQSTRVGAMRMQVDLDASDDELMLEAPKHRREFASDDGDPEEKNMDVVQEGADAGTSEQADDEYNEMDEDDAELEYADEDEDISSDDEENTILLKDADEQEEIRNEINDLCSSLPALDDDYELLDRLGTGTFSSVYKAIDKGYHAKWDNSPWLGDHPQGSSAHFQSVKKHPATNSLVAVKRIYVTSSPERIRNEISILEDCLGCRHVSQLITAFRCQDQVVIVMPHQKNADFREFFQELPIECIKSYLRCLFRALRDIHARKIIHRDVKPANFLFDPRTGNGTLCDFGLACRMEPTHNNFCLHTSYTKDKPHGTNRMRKDYDVELVKKLHKDAQMKSLTPSENVGYPAKDTRPHSKANRAGTRGFRAPEVLLKCGDQNGAVDVWSTGMILLFFLTRKFPLFQANDDTEALMELATILGKRKMEMAAMLHSRTFATNVPSVTPEGMSWKNFVQKQNPDLYEPLPPNPDYFPYYRKHSSCYPPTSTTPSSSRQSSPSAPDSPTKTKHASDVEHALDLLEKIMHHDSTKRYTPREALYHPFLREEGVSDDDFFPHPYGQGMCGDMHFRDTVTEEPFVKIGGQVKRLVAGEGIAIGNEPCKFHRDGWEQMRTSSQESQRGPRGTGDGGVLVDLDEDGDDGVA